MKTLYIIGNGFDLHHNLKSSYNDFREYVQRKDSELLYYLGSYFSCDNLWSDFEENLAKLDVNEVFLDNNELLPDEDSERDGDKYQHPDMIKHIVSVLTTGLVDILNDWILNFNYEIPKEYSLKLDKSSLFLTFNYSDTLESFYEIPHDKIIYIHNKAEPRLKIKPDEVGIINPHSELIIGHSRNGYQPKLSSKVNNGIKGFIYEESKRNITPYYELSYKNSDRIIQGHKHFFDNLNTIERVIVIGHSLSPVDLKYFKEISIRISKNAKWIISYRNHDSLRKLKTNSKDFVSQNQIVNYQNITKIKDFT